MASKKKAKKRSKKSSKKGKVWSCTLKRKDGTKGKPVHRKAARKPKKIKVGKRRIKATCKLLGRKS